MTETVHTTEKRSQKLVGLLWWLLALMCVPGGVLWALTPLGVMLSELKFKTPDVFWKLFPSAPLLMLAGLVGLRLWRRGGFGRWQKLGFYVALAGIILTVAGDIGEFYLFLDDVYLMTAPFYRMMRLGFILLTLGSMVLGVAAARSRALPIWSALPFAICSLAGLISVLQDFESFGAALWITFGIGWAWLGFGLLVEGAVSFLRSLRRRKKT